MHNEKCNILKHLLNSIRQIMKLCSHNPNYGVYKKKTVTVPTPTAFLNTVSIVSDRDRIQCAISEYQI